MNLCKKFCKETFIINLVFNSFKIKNYPSYKDPIPNDLKSFLVYKFTCASCSSSYIGETCRNLKLGLRNISKRITSLIFLNICTPPQHCSFLSLFAFLLFFCVSLSSTIFIISDTNFRHLLLS